MLWSAVTSPVGRCLGSVLIAKPNKASWIIGIITIMARVGWSRFN